MKKVIGITFIIIVLSLLQGCDRYSGRRPSEQENTKWVSQNPDIYFEVSKNYGEITGSNTYGKIVIDGITTEIAVDFPMEPNVYFRPITAFHKGDGDSPGYINGDDWLFMGACKFSPDKLVVKIVNNDKGFLDDSIKQIIFIKEEIPDDV